MDSRLMGTNYYWHEPESLCPHCGRGDGDELHIGKSSSGWCFSLRIHPDKGINDLPDWIKRWKMPESVIKDEYGTELSVDDMMLVVMARFRLGGEPFSPQWLAENYAKPGPFGLARHGDGIAGDGPYDLCDYEFS